MHAKTFVNTQGNARVPRLTKWWYISLVLRWRTHLALTNVLIRYITLDYEQSRGNSHKIKGLVTAKRQTSEQIQTDMIEDKHLINLTNHLPSSFHNILEKYYPLVSPEGRWKPYVKFRGLKNILT